MICGPGPAADVPVFDLERLCPGHALTGPALLESDKTTIWVAPGWQARIDRFANLLLTKG